MSNFKHEEEAISRGTELRVSAVDLGTLQVSGSPPELKPLPLPEPITRLPELHKPPEKDGIRSPEITSLPPEITLPREYKPLPLPEPITRLPELHKPPEKDGIRPPEITRLPPEITLPREYKPLPLPEAGQSKEGVGDIKVPHARKPNRMPSP